MAANSTQPILEPSLCGNRVTSIRTNLFEAGLRIASAVEAVERSRRFVSWADNATALLIGLSDRLDDWHRKATARLRNEPSIPGIEDYWTAAGVNPLQARFTATFGYNLSPPIVAEIRICRKGISLIRSIARSKSNRKKRQALLGLIDDTNLIRILDAYCELKELPNSSSLHALRNTLVAAIGSKRSLPSLTRLCSQLSRELPETRGRARSREFYAEYIWSVLMPEQAGLPVYTFDPISGDYIDARTAAVRKALRSDRFSPHGARRTVLAERRKTQKSSARPSRFSLQ